MARDINWSAMELVDGELITKETKVLHPDTCPFFIFDGSHYDDAGKCKCDEPAERERLIAEWDYTEDDFREAGLIE